jgi:integrase
VQLARYSSERQEAGAAVSTVRNELNILKYAMKLAHRQGLLATLPAFPSLTPTNVRTGFFERLDLDAMLSELPEPVRPVVTFMYWTGWRRGEVLSRRWEHVDLGAGVIRLDPGETKNGRGREFPFALIPELKAVVERQRAYTEAVERRLGEDVPWVFHREGKPIKSFRSAWRLASKRVALGALAAQQGTTPRELWRKMSREERRAFKGLGLIPHDFRRTAVRNLVRAGVSQKVAMELTGHLTPALFERYNITDDRDRRAAVVKLAATTAAPRQVGAVGPTLDPNDGGRP